MFRIGHGYDVHAFEEGKKLILAGVEIEFSKGMKAHSDGDVVIHALCDALLGAAALGDIGQHFPDTDQKYKNVDSRILLTRVAGLLLANHFLISNLDIAIIAQVPKLAPYIFKMRETIAADLKLTIDQVSIKATTNESMGFVGRCEGIAVHAVALIYPEYMLNNSSSPA